MFLRVCSRSGKLGISNLRHLLPGLRRIKQTREFREGKPGTILEGGFPDHKGGLIFPKDIFTALRSLLLPPLLIDSKSVGVRSVFADNFSPPTEKVLFVVEVLAPFLHGEARGYSLRIDDFTLGKVGKNGLSESVTDSIIVQAGQNRVTDLLHRDINNDAAIMEGKRWVSLHALEPSIFADLDHGFTGYDGKVGLVCKWVDPIMGTPLEHVESLAYVCLQADHFPEHAYSERHLLPLKRGVLYEVRTPR